MLKQKNKRNKRERISDIHLTTTIEILCCFHILKTDYFKKVNVCSTDIPL